MKIYLKILLLIFLFLVAVKVPAQNTVSTTEEMIADIYEQISEESETEIDFTSFYDDLMSLSENPIRLNHTDKEELEKLQFLSQPQIDNILYYLYKNAPMNSIYELQLIDGLDMTDIRRMLPFVTLGDADAVVKKIRFSDMMKYGKNELYFRLDKGLETKEGYRFYPDEEESLPDESNKKYFGDPFYTSLKYRFNFKDRIQAGITTEKDAGEQFWGANHKGYDFYSAHFQLNDFGKLKTLVLGDYRANFGQGLVMRTDFSMGKSAYATNITPHQNGLKKYSSTDEYNFFRGFGATFRLGKFDATAFYSNKMIDADTSGGFFTTIKKDGLHRLSNDLDKKQTVNQQVLGGNIRFQRNWFQLGATAYYSHFNQALLPETNNYNQYYFRGKNQSAGSIDYRFKWQKLNFFGETSVSDHWAAATLNGVNFSPVSTVSLVALYRNFSSKYDVLFANTFSEGSRVNNESGFYIGAEICPVKYWKISTYIDSYRFPWAKFSVDAPSVGKDYLIQATYSPKRNVSMYWRFKFEQNEKNYADTLSVMPVILPQQKWQARYRLSYSFGDFNFRNEIDVNSANDGVSKSTYGFSALQDISYQFTKIPLQLDLRLQIFDAQNFENRIYVYEQDVLYAFSVPMVYGIGTRYYVNLKYEASKKLSLWFKLAQTIYADEREAISSGNEQISGNRKTDVRFLLCWKF